jgi:hypothetical protein
MLGLQAYFVGKHALFWLCFFVLERGLLRRRAIATQSHWPSASICSTRRGGNLGTRCAQTA